MAEENLDGLEAAEPGAAPAEGEEQGNNQEDQTNPEIEALASKMGWAPQDQFRGPAEEWKPAEDFILASREINRSLSRDLRGVREQLSRVGSVTDQIIADKVAERDAYWQNQHRQAVEDGNHELAERAVDERVKLKAQQPASQNGGEPPETIQFREQHSAWFGKNRLATGRAMEVAERSRQLGASVAEQLQDAEAAVRREFPELFPQAKRPAAVDTGRARNAGNGSGKKGFADMPAESQAIARDYLERHGTPLETFARNFWAQQERKVG